MDKIQYYDANQIEGRSMTIVLDNGKLETISKNSSKGAGIRALCQGSWGYTSIDGETDLKVGIQNASELAASMNRNTPKDKIILGQVPKRKVGSMPAIKINPKDISMEDKVELLREIEKHAKEEGIKSTRVSYSESILTTRFMNSENEEREYKTVRSGFAVSAVAAEGSNYQAGRESRFNISGYEIFEKNDPYELAKHAAETAKSLLTAKTPKGGALPVILDPELAGVFAHEAVGHASEADLVLQNDSVLSGKLGKQIASPQITVIDDPTLHEYGYYPFDAEGVPSEKTVLIQDGVMNSYMHSRETAGIFDGVSGNSRAQGYSMPVVRMSNTYIDKGDATFEEMLEDIKDGIYLIGSRGGQVNTGEGVFQFNAEKGYMIKNGEVSDLVRDVSLSGQTLDILNHIKMVGNDVKLTAGHCGKSGQTVPVTDGAPHISISKATVGGA
ncbi:Metalloprotease TldD [Methanimicrococcus hongohii]|uniref:Metalloprotease TldD n=1 Tax=Methanimicrococcus hongohii TaxID=3028295 RepID=A0AA96UYA2_9EURY|nr:TldD/PmbA family protein [Methanimicrococcus sp. Hf6]WNY22829.1 Metalloprotease TldD [Methanimicrococcus sp. Hf6]